MKETLDMSVHVAGIEFKSPILVASSECTADVSLAEKLTDMNIGGIVTKTFTTRSEHKIRVRPYQFPLNVFGKAYREGKCLYSLAAPHVEGIEAWLEKVSQMSRTCREKSVALIVSYFEDPAQIALWVSRAKAFEEAGADMLELNFSCPHTARVFAQSFEASKEVISSVKKNTSIPVGIKISPTLDPLEAFVASCSQVSLDFITAHNAPAGILIDVENERPFGAPSIGGYAMGRAFLPYSLARIVRIRKVTDMPVIGVGGISEPADALQYLLCGCPLVGIGSAMYFKGFEIPDKLYHGISEWMQNKNYQSVNEFIGKVLPLIQEPVMLGAKEKYPFTMPPDCPYTPVVNEDKCNLCGLCERSCIYDALRIDDKRSRVIADEHRCWSCGFCVGICPVGAIELRDRQNKSKVIWNNQGMAASFKTISSPSQENT